MADTKLSGLAEIASAALTDYLYIVDDPAGTPVSNAITLTDLFGAAGMTVDGDTISHTPAGASANIDSTLKLISKGTAAGRIFLQGDSTNKLFSLNKAATGGQRLDIYAGTGGPGLSIGADGRCAIGNVSTISADLHIEGPDMWLINPAADARIVMGEGTSPGAYVQLKWMSSLNTFDIQTSGGTAAVRVDDGTANVGIGVTPSQKFEIGSADNSDRISIYHDNTDARLTWDDGALYLATVEAVNSNSAVRISGAGTGIGVLELYDQDDAEYLILACQSGSGQVQTAGSSPGTLRLQHNAHANILMFDSAGSGETPVLAISGFRTGDALRTLSIGISATANDTAVLSGVTNLVLPGSVIGAGVSSMNASAVLQADSTTRGFLPPRMTTTQRDAISTPATGLIIWNTTTGQLEDYNGSAWAAV